jgi:hypothetical protein
MADGTNMKNRVIHSIPFWEARIISQFENR